MVCPRNETLCENVLRVEMPPLPSPSHRWPQCNGLHHQTHGGTVQYGHILVLAIGEDENHAHNKVEDGVLLPGRGGSMMLLRVTVWGLQDKHHAHHEVEDGVLLRGGGG